MLESAGLGVRRGPRLHDSLISLINTRVFYRSTARTSNNLPHQILFFIQATLDSTPGPPSQINAGGGCDNARPWSPTPSAPSHKRGQQRLPVVTHSATSYKRGVHPTTPNRSPPPVPPRTPTWGCVQLGLPATPPPTPLRTQTQPGCRMYPHAFVCEGHLRAYLNL
jgi:hypothetical protein